MKKFTFFISIFAFLAISSKAQVIYSEDFESLNVGEGIALQVPEWWKTWNDSPGSAEDADISENYAVSGTKSLMVLTAQDVVMTTENLTEGRYKMSFEMYIAENRVAYLSAMQLFDPGNPIYGWGISIRFNNGSGEIKHGTTMYDAASFSFEHDTWFSFTYFIDLDADIVNIISNDELIYTGHWSVYPDSYSLQGFMFFGWDPGEYYIDDIVFEQVPAVNPPQNLSLELQNQNDILVSWDAPVAGNPDSYYVFRNGTFVEEVIGTTSFTDYNIYPAEYEYYIAAYYGADNGFSAPSETESILIEGGTQRQLIVLEVFTGMECDNSGWIAMSLNLLNNLNLDVAVLNYFSDEDYQIENMTSRMDYYTPFFDSDGSGHLTCPSSIVDGRVGMEGYTGTLATQRNFWSSNINEFLDIKTLYNLNNTIDLLSANPYTFSANVEIEEIFEFYTGDFYVYMALTESNIDEEWQGASGINYLVRMLDFENINFENEKSNSVNFEFDLAPDYDINNMDLVIFLQHAESATIVESFKTSLSDIAKIEKKKLFNYSVYPNPTTGHIFIKSQNIQNISVINIEGKTIIQKDNLNTESVSLDLSKYEKGIYIIKIVTENGVAIDKLILK